jgi:hypothetical protein
MRGLNMRADQPAGENMMTSRLPVQQSSALFLSTAIAKFGGYSGRDTGRKLRLRDVSMQTLRRARFDDMVIAG